MTGSKSSPCPKCGTPIPSGGEGKGICPRCVLEFAFQADSAEQTGSYAKLPAAEDPPLTGMFGPYRIVSMLGKGGMAVVYLADQVSLARRVALKVLPSSMARDIEFTERFQREARALATLSHPNIVGVFDSGCIDGRYYYAMEYVEGTSLRKLLQSKKLLPSRALEIVPQLCDALQYAHEKGVVHRDVKPENILIDRVGRVKIADFGLAKVLTGEAARTSALTGTMEILGTPHYIAPEQLERPRDVDHRADIYALGVVIYEMLTGELPIGKFDPPSWKAPVDPRWDAIVMKAMQNEPERRFKDVAALKEETTRATARRTPVAPTAPTKTATPIPARVTPTSATRVATSQLQTTIPPRRVPLVPLYVAAGIAALGIGVLLGKSASKQQEAPPAQPVTTVVSLPPVDVTPPTEPDPGTPPETTVSTTKEDPPTTTATDPPKADPEPPKTQPPSAVMQDLKALDDDFQYQGDLSSDWKRLHETEHAPDPFIMLGVHNQVFGMVPHTSLWYADYRGPLVYKLVEGDFVITTRLRVASRRSFAVPPKEEYSVAGLMVRAPREVTKETWKPGGENYFYCGMGRTKDPGLHFEVKDTRNSNTRMKEEWEAQTEAVIRLAWVRGDYFVIAKTAKLPWHILMRGYRPDLPKTLQVGFACMTDTKEVWKRFAGTPAEYNWQGCPDANPDLGAAFQYAHFRRPAVPEGYEKLDLTQPWENNIKEKYLLTFLGDAIPE